MHFINGASLAFTAAMLRYTLLLKLVITRVFILQARVRFILHFFSVNTDA